MPRSRRGGLARVGVIRSRSPPRRVDNGLSDRGAERLPRFRVPTGLLQVRSPQASRTKNLHPTLSGLRERSHPFRWDPLSTPDHIRVENVRQPCDCDDFLDSHCCHVDELAARKLHRGTLCSLGESFVRIVEQY
jgi:hypothetical protein